MLPALQTRSEAFQLTMSDWFAMHILDFEVDHRDFLQDVISQMLENEKDIESFLTGFRNALDAMDSWWIGISEKS